MATHAAGVVIAGDKLAEQFLYTWTITQINFTINPI